MRFYEIRQVDRQVADFMRRWQYIALRVMHRLLKGSILVPVYLPIHRNYIIKNILIISAALAVGGTVNHSSEHS